MKQTQTHPHREETCGVRGRGWRAMDQKFVINKCKLVYRKWINNKVLLYNTGNCIPYLVINHNGKNIKRMYICLTGSLRCIAELTQHCKSTISQFCKRRNIYKRDTQCKLVSVANFRVLEQSKMLFKRELFWRESHRLSERWKRRCPGYPCLQ